MQKSKLILAAGLVAAMSLASVASASPLKNYDAGKIAVDAGISLPSSVDVDTYAHISKNNSSYFGATTGIGKNMALSYKWNNFKGDDTQTKAQQFNLQYKLLPGIAAYTGYLHANTEMGNSDKTNGSGQVGLIASYDIPLLFTVWGNVSYGTDNKGYEIGVSKPLLNNIELNASYYDHTFGDAVDGNKDLQTKGVNLGLTVKF